MSEVTKDGIDPITRVKNLIRTNYDPKECGYTELRSEGNYSDVFEDGMMCGQSTILYAIGCILGMDLPPPEEQEY